MERTNYVTVMLMLDAHQDDAPTIARLLDVAMKSMRPAHRCIVAGPKVAGEGAPSYVLTADGVDATS